MSRLKAYCVGCEEETLHVTQGLVSATASRIVCTRCGAESVFIWKQRSIFTTVLRPRPVDLPPPDEGGQVEE
jgi:hypothetical protein